MINIKYLVIIAIYNVLLYLYSLNARGPGFEDMIAFILGLIVTIPINLIIGKLFDVKIGYSLSLGIAQTLIFIIVLSIHSS